MPCGFCPKLREGHDDGGSSEGGSRGSSEGSVGPPALTDGSVTTCLRVSKIWGGVYEWLKDVGVVRKWVLPESVFGF